MTRRLRACSARLPQGTNDAYEGSRPWGEAAAARSVASDPETGCSGRRSTAARRVRRVRRRVRGVGTQRARPPQARATGCHLVPRGRGALASPPPGRPCAAARIRRVLFPGFRPDLLRIAEPADGKSVPAARDTFVHRVRPTRLSSRTYTRYAVERRQPPNRAIVSSSPGERSVGVVTVRTAPRACDLHLLPPLSPTASCRLSLTVEHSF